MTTLGHDFPKEQERVRELLTEYESLGHAGVFGAIMIKDVLRRSELVGDDTTAMIRSYQELKGCK